MPPYETSSVTSSTGDEQARAAFKAAQRALRTGDPFNTWVIESASASTNSSTTIWNYWVGSGTNSSASLTGSEVWRIWNSASATGSQIFIPPVPLLAPAPEHARVREARARVNARMSAEERALHEDYERRSFAKAEEDKAARKLAAEKAEVLLRQMLTPEQEHDLEQKSCFYLYSGDKKYRIDRGRTGNVKLVDDKDQVVESYCIHPQLDCPDADTMLAQKLLLETDRETFERVANITARAAHGRTRAGVGLAVAR